MMWRATAGMRSWPPEVDLTRTVGWFTTKYPVALSVGGLDWAQVAAGEPGLGAWSRTPKNSCAPCPTA